MYKSAIKVLVAFLILLCPSRTRFSLRQQSESCFSFLSNTPSLFSNTNKQDLHWRTLISNLCLSNEPTLWLVLRSIIAVLQLHKVSHAVKLVSFTTSYTGLDHTGFKIWRTGFRKHISIQNWVAFEVKKNIKKSYYSWRADQLDSSKKLSGPLKEISL